MNIYYAFISKVREGEYVKMDILVVGNSFDLQHDSPTRHSSSSVIDTKNCKYR